MNEKEDFKDEYRLDSLGLVDLEYNKARFVHIFGQERWDELMAALDNSSSR